MFALASRRPLAAAAVALAALGAVALGWALLRGGDSSSSPPAGTPAPAAAGLPIEDALPGTGWSPAETTELTSATPSLAFALIPEVSGCEGLREAERLFQANEAAFSSGQSHRYGRLDAGGGRTTVTLVRVEFTDSLIPQSLLEAIEETFAAGAATSCLEAAARRDGVAVLAMAQPAPGVPPGGVAQAITLRAPPGEPELRAWQLLAWWRDGSRLGAFSMVSTASMPTAAELATLLDAAASAMKGSSP